MAQFRVENLEEAVVAERGSRLVMQPEGDVAPKRMRPELALSKEVSIPARALFEHPVPATTFFEAADGGAAGLTVTLEEPLEYGLDVNNWSISGHQRYEGTPDTPAELPSIAGGTFTHTRYVGEHTTANLPGRGGYGTDWHAAYDTTRNLFVIGNSLNDWDAFDISLAAPRGWQQVFGNPPTVFPWLPSAVRHADWASQITTGGIFEYANQDALEASLGANIETWTGIYGSSQNVLWFDQSAGDVKIFGVVTPARPPFIAAASEFTDQDDSNLFGTVVRNAGQPAPGTVPFNEVFYYTPGTQGGYGWFNASIVVLTDATFRSTFEDYFWLGIHYDAVTEVNASANLVLSATDNIYFNLHNIDGADGNGWRIIGLTPGTNGLRIVRNNAARTFTLEYEGNLPTYVQLYGVIDAYADLSRDTSLGNVDMVTEPAIAGGSATFSGGRDASTDEDLGAFADEDAVTTYLRGDPDIWANRGSRFPVYYDIALGQLRKITDFDNDGILYVPPVAGEPDDPIHIIMDRDNENFEIYYNNAARGRLTAADELGDIRDFINTHFEGLSAVFTGGADANTAVTRVYTTRDNFSGGSLSGLEIYILDQLAFGEEGNNWEILARPRFGGGGEQAETQAQISIYTRSDRAGGIRATLDANINGLNEHGIPVDVSSGELGNEWTFTVAAASGADSNVVRISPANREIIYYALSDVDSVVARDLFTALSAGGSGVSAVSFGQYNENSQLFTGSVGRINSRPIRFRNGQDYHPPTSISDPISVNIGPANARTRLFPNGRNDGGILVTLEDPANQAGNGWTLVSAHDNTVTNAIATKNDLTRQITVTFQSDTNYEDANLVIARLNDLEGVSAELFGTGVVDDSFRPDVIGRHEFLNGLDEEQIEIQYAEDAYGLITDADTMGEVKAVIDAVDGLVTFYYGGANANTTANRHTPWEHNFENGRTAIVQFSSIGLGPPQNIFGDRTTANRAAAEALRDAYQSANPAWSIPYLNNDQLWIVLRWNGGEAFQVLDDNGWHDVTLALIGPDGPPGPAPSDAHLNALIQALLPFTLMDLDDLRARVTTLEGYHRVPTLIYYFGWSDDQAIDTSDFANFASSMTFEGVLPARATEGYIVIAVPESEGVPEELFIAGGPDSIDAYMRIAGTIDDSNGDPHIVLVSRQEQTHLFAGQTIVLGYS